ncbi:MAG: WecB/TagA/CpsF family glycosyltransferase [Terracidiphilus sp.]|jgi:exopolysaccharide biosynthesis WecB/TagA/CpsF family protein
MIDRGAGNILGVRVHAVDYEFAASQIIKAAKAGRRCTTSALAVHALVTAAVDGVQRYRLNHFDLVVPDGRPVCWALNLLNHARLRDVVFGPTLTGLVCAEAERQGISVYFYGSNEETLVKLRPNLLEKFPGLILAGSEPGKFRTLSDKEQLETADHIRNSKAGILFVGLGCPRQEIFTYEMGNLLSMPILAVGAAFDYHAGLLKESPRFLERLGLRWLHRLAQEPRRLWRRYLVTNTLFIVMFIAQWLHFWRPNLENATRPAGNIRFG